MDEVTVKVEGGEVILRKPTAGMRNKALVKADTSEGFKRSLMMIELLPMCIKTHPWALRNLAEGSPLKTALEGISVEEYDTLIDGLEQLMGKKDLKKKLSDTSDPEDPEKSGSLDSTLTTTTTPSK